MLIPLAIQGYPRTFQHGRNTKLMGFCWDFLRGYETTMEVGWLIYSWYKMVTYMCLSLIL